MPHLGTVSGSSLIPDINKSLDISDRILNQVQTQRNREKASGLIASIELRVHAPA